MEKVIEKRVFMNSEVPHPLERQARIAAAHLGISRSELIRQALNEYLQRLKLEKSIQVEAGNVQN